MPYLFSNVYDNEFFIAQEPPCWYGHTVGPSVTPFFVDKKLNKIPGKEVTREIFAYNLSLFFRSGTLDWKSGRWHLEVSAYGESWLFQREEIDEIISCPLTEEEKFFLLKELGEYHNLMKERIEFAKHTIASIERIGDKYFFLDVFPGHEIKGHWQSGWERGNKVIIKKESVARVFPAIESISSVPFVEGLGNELRYIESMSDMEKEKYGVN